MTSQPLPTGTRDVLAEEMRELRTIESTLLELFASRGYEEVATPTIEYQDVFARGAGPEGTAAYRFLDESGSVLALRNDMTVPIARLVAAGSRPIRPVPARLLGQRLPTGPPAARPAPRVAPDRRRADRLRCPGGNRGADRGPRRGARRRRAAARGRRPRRRRPLPPLLDEFGVEGGAKERILDRLTAHDLVAIEAEAGDLADLGEAERATIVALSDLRGGPEVLDRARSLGGPAIERASTTLAETLAALASRRDRRSRPGRLRPAPRSRLLHRRDPRGLRPRRRSGIGGGGRYDDLLGRFGRPLPRPASRSSSSGSTSPRPRSRTCGAADDAASVRSRGNDGALTPGAAARLPVRGLPRDARPRRFDTSEPRSDSAGADLRRSTG